MNYEVKGALIPVGGGDNIPLIKDRITIGRRESCDVCLRFPNISGMHLELTFEDECWRARDLGSTNGIKINGVFRKRAPLSAIGSIEQFLFEQQVGADEQSVACKGR